VKFLFVSLFGLAAMTSILQSQAAFLEKAAECGLSQAEIDSLTNQA
jgi:hypothetical protein